MGRKKGQQQRTKGNVLPSSSVRSADLLAKESVTSNQGNFQSVSLAGLGNVPELAGLDSIANIEFRTVLKKLYKRDVTTKLKALTEFSELCNTCKEYEVLTVLPYWPRIYNRLFEDSDRRVRENSQKAMRALVTAAGKNLALQLKNVMGCWFLSQCDLYAPSALEAEAAIVETFAGDKKIEAFVFCRTEILKCITHYLFGPQAKREKATDQEGNNYHRIMASCMGAFSLFIHNVVAYKPVAGEIEEFLDKNGFWKLQKHYSPSVRGGFYSVIEALCLVCPDLLDAHLGEACKSVFHRLDESNVAVGKPLYGAAVALVTKCDSWHEAVDIQKGLIPGLCSILKSGCHGLGAYVLPSLLPILAKIPSSIDLFAMFSKIFEAMRICLNHEQVKPSRHGSELAISAYFELLLLSISRFVKEIDDPDLKKLTKAVLNENILYLLEESFAERCNKSSVWWIYSQLSRTIHAWDGKIAANGSHTIYNYLCDGFWVTVDNLVGRYAFKANDLFSTQLVVQFLNEILHYDGHTKVRQRSVKFEKSDQDCSSSEASSRTSLTNSQRVLHNINNIVSAKLLAFPWKEPEKNISVYKDIVEKLGNRELFVLIFDQSSFSEDKKTVDKVAGFIDKVLLKEVYSIMTLKKEHKMGFLEMLSDIIFFSVRHCKPSEIFPVDATHLIGAEITKPHFAVSLHFVFTLERYANSDPVIANWLCDLLANIGSPAWGLLKSVANFISKCGCSYGAHTSFIDVEKGWNLLEAVVTKSFASSSGEVKFLCSPDGYISILKNLLSDIECLNACESCYPVVLSRTCTVMLSCLKTGRSYDMTPLNEGGQSVWLRLMTELIRTHCFNENENHDLLSCFSEFCSHAVSERFPFSGPDRVDVAEFLGSQARWMRERLLQLHSQGCCGITDNFKKFLTVVFEISYTEGCILIENLLPSAAELESTRGSYGDVISSGEICLLQDSEPNHITSSRYLELLRFFRELIVHVVSIPSFQTDEKKLCEQEALLTHAKELVMAATLISDFELIGSLMHALGSKFDSHLRSVILEKSIEDGSIWPHCARLYGSQYRQEEWDVVLEKFKECCESSDISHEVYETMTVALEFVPSEKLGLIDCISQLSAVNPEIISASDVYLFSLIVKAIGSNLERNKDSVKETLDIAIKWRSSKDSLFAFDEDMFNEAEPHILCLNSSAAQLFTHSVNTLAESLSEPQWDFILCALLSWVESLSKSFEEISKEIPLITLLKNSCALLQEVNTFMLSPIAKEDPTVPSNLLHEWSEFFSAQINASLVKIFLSTDFSTLPISCSKRVMKCVQHAPLKSIIATGSELKPRLSPDSSLPPEVQTVINCLCPMLHTKTGSPLRQGLIIGTAYTLLSSMLENLVDNETLSAPESLLNILRKLSSDVESLFAAADTEVVKSPLPGSEESNDDSEYEEEKDDAGDSFKTNILENAPAVLGYFLVWKLLINLTSAISAERKSVYIETLIKGNNVNLTEDLLPKIFKIMIGKKSLFKGNPELLFEDDFQLEHLEHVVASLYRDFLVQMPATSRTWFNDLTKSVRARVDKFTSIHVSPVLIEEEFRAVQVTKQQQAVEGMEIIARPSAREVHASYKLNEIEMEIAVCLSANHPLGPINVKTEKRAGVVMGQWRYWLLQITMFLQYQNGGIIDGLLLWKDKVDKRFEGVEECMICFSVVHGSSQSLPKLKCKTCKKKYHAECLYKWFDTSNNSTCPLCRSPMIFR